MSIVLPIPRERLLAAAALPENAGSAAGALRHLAGLQGHGTTSTGVREAQGHKRGDGDATDAIRLTLPLPPSVNSYWRSVPASKNRIARVLVSEQGRKFKRLCQTAALAQCKKPLTGDVSLCGVVYFADRRRDLDNCLKPLLDALNRVVYVDDRQIAHLELTKRIDRQRPRVELTVAPFDSDEPHGP